MFSNDDEINFKTFMIFAKHEISSDDILMNVVINSASEDMREINELSHIQAVQNFPLEKLKEKIG